jgi:hypothetical protein
MPIDAHPQGHHTKPNQLEYHIVSTLTQRRTIHPSHGHTQPLGDDSTLHRRTMPQPLGDDSTLTKSRTMPHHVGMPNIGLPLRSTSTQSQRRTYRGGCLTMLQSSTPCGDGILMILFVDICLHTNCYKRK